LPLVGVGEQDGDPAGDDGRYEDAEDQQQQLTPDGHLDDFLGTRPLPKTIPALPVPNLTL
jgi:hypothetical protein